MYSKSSEAESPRRFQPQTRSGILRLTVEGNIWALSYATGLKLQRMKIGWLGQSTPAHAYLHRSLVVVTTSL
jgi:hypothetical protein